MKKYELYYSPKHNAWGVYMDGKLQIVTRSFESFLAGMTIIYQFTIDAVAKDKAQPQTAGVSHE